MSDTTWKAFEREVARDLGGRRVGPSGGAGPDAQSSWAVAECKYRTRPSWTDIEEAMVQIMASGPKDKLKLVAIKKRGKKGYYVVIRDDEFFRWTGSRPDPDAGLELREDVVDRLTKAPASLLSAEATIKRLWKAREIPDAEQDSMDRGDLEPDHGL